MTDTNPLAPIEALAEVFARQERAYSEHNGSTYAEGQRDAWDSAESYARDALAEARQAVDALVAERDAAREALARVEALTDWHETKAEKARRYRPEVNGENLIMDKAAEVHDDAARRLRDALAQPATDEEAGQ